MALDGAFLHLIKDEITAEIGAHLDKIYQPSKDELVFLLRSKNGAKRLLLCAAPGRSRLHFTQTRPENPATPPMFCMALRKYLGAARLCDVSQTGLERVLTLTFSATNEMGDVIYPRLVCELIGASPNLLLCDQNGTILMAVRYSDLEAGGRLIQPGAVYTPPPAVGKLSLLTTEPEELAQATLRLSGLSLQQALLKTAEGLSPLMCRETVYRAFGDIDRSVDSLDETDRATWITQLTVLRQALLVHPQPTLLSGPDGNAVEFSFLPLTHYGTGYVNQSYPSPCTVLDAYYAKKDLTARIKKEGQDIHKCLTTLSARAEKRLSLRLGELKASRDRERYRIYGELLKANLHTLQKGSDCCTLINYYDPGGATVTVPLDPALTPAMNADRYFKEYKKSYAAERALSGLIEQDKNDLAYFDSVLDALSRAASMADLAAIREELAQTGFIRCSCAKSSKPPAGSENPLQFLLPGGYRLAVGKNNRQNDRLTLHTAAKTDLWFHVKDYPGSHAILFCADKEPDEATLLLCAAIAAFHSKAVASGLVEVNYTRVRYVKKPTGAKPGMVIFTHETTVRVAPQDGRNFFCQNGKN